MSTDLDNERIPKFKSIHVKNDISESAWSDLARKFARDCFRACTQDHEMCRQGETILPTRVINVGNVSDERLRLLETTGSTVGQYAALSYCWGGDQPLKTTTTNINDMISGQLRLSELPQTLADAVHVTRSLGIKYLWIDALCIIQDSSEDWERESEYMLTVYAKAHLVIAASSSSSATQGFLSHQRQHQSHHLTLPDHYGYGKPVVLGAYVRPTSYRTDPLDERAWALQEQHMATRRLIFSADELQWVCNTNIDCECGILPYRPSYQSLLLPYADDMRQAVASGGPSLQIVWRKAVCDYTDRTLTHADDKLPAFSGLASWFGARVRSQYLAGLWKDSILQDLAWTVSESSYQALPSDYRAPSFSWASVNERVDYCFQQPNLEGYWEEPESGGWDWVSSCSVSDTGSVVPGRNSFGKVTDAWITISAPMMQGRLGCMLDDLEYRIRFVSDFGAMDLNLDSAVAEFSYVDQHGEQGKSVRRRQLPQNFEEIRKGCESDNPYHLLEFTETETSVVSQASVWMLLLGRWTEGQTTDNKPSRCHYYYLLLGKSPRDLQKYERLGSHHHSTKKPVLEHESRFAIQTVTIL